MSSIHNKDRCSDFYVTFRTFRNQEFQEKSSHHCKCLAYEKGNNLPPNTTACHETFLLINTEELPSSDFVKEPRA